MYFADIYTDNFIKHTLISKIWSQDRLTLEKINEIAQVFSDLLVVTKKAEDLNNRSLNLNEKIKASKVLELSSYEQRFKSDLNDVKALQDDCVAEFNRILNPYGFEAKDIAQKDRYSL